MNLHKIQKKIIEIENIIQDKIPGADYATSRHELVEKERLLATLRSLERQEQFLSSEKQVKISKWTGVCTVLIGALAVISAFCVPWYQKMIDQQEEIQVIYKNLITNTDILMSNSNSARNFMNATNTAQLPEKFFDTKIEGDSGRILQEKFGLIQYRFFVFFLGQIRLLNQEIDQMGDALMIDGITSMKYVNARKSYLITLGELNKEGVSAKFSYIRDLECLTYFFERSFSYLSIDPRGKIDKCSNESYYRIFQFGFLEAATPRWMLPGFKNTLNEFDPANEYQIDLSGGY